MTNYLKRFITTLTLGLILSSCVNLKHVNHYSTASLQSIQSFEDLNYSFKLSCLDKCIDIKTNNLQINSHECDCQLEKTADSITSKIYNTIQGYFDGLARLSNKEFAIYKTESLETALPENIFRSFKIEKKHAASYSKISEIILRTFTDSYSQKKIKNYINEANEPIKELLSFLDFTISSNLYGKLNVKKERVKSYYFDLIQDTSLSIIEKKSLVTEYYYKKNIIENQQKKLKIYSKALQKIALGHQELYEGLENLSMKEMTQTLFQYASEIHSIASEFRKTKD